jgi:hypothetical protein
MAAELGRLDAALDRAGQGQPQVLLVLEDLHWADRATLDLVAFLARALHSGRVTLAAPGGRGATLPTPCWPGRGRCRAPRSR